MKVRNPPKMLIKRHWVNLFKSKNQAKNVKFYQKFDFIPKNNDFRQWVKFRKSKIHKM